MIVDEFTDLVNDASRDGASALNVAQDLLLEHEKTLAWVSGKSIGRTTGDAGLFVLTHDGGVWTVGKSSPPIVEWGAYWSVRYRRPSGYYIHNGWYATVTWYIDGVEYDSLPARYGLPSYRVDREVAIDDAVRLAWAGTRMLADWVAKKVKPLLDPEKYHSEDIRSRLYQADWSSVPSSLASGLKPKSRAKPNPAGAAPTPGHYREVQFAGPRVRVTDTNGRNQIYPMEAATDSQSVADTFTFLTYDRAEDLEDTIYLDQYLRFGDVNTTYDLMGYTEAMLTALFQMVFPGAVPVPYGEGEPIENPGGGTGAPTRYGAIPTTTINVTTINVNDYEPEQAAYLLWSEVTPDLVNDDNLAQYGWWGNGGELVQIVNLVGYTPEELQLIRDLIAAYGAGDDDSPMNNPADCKPCATRTFKPNPPSWVTKHLADSWVTLEGMVPAPWMPKLDRTVSKGKKLTAEIPEYGCGVYGCVMPTLDPKIVLKVTTDQAEAEFAARMAKKMPANLVTKYELVLELPTAKQRGRPVYLLWREEAQHVGEVDKVLGGHVEAAIDKQHAAAQVALQEAWAFEPGDSTRSLVEALGTWLATLDGLGQTSALATLADGMRQAFAKERVFFGDVHGGNLGLANGNWVITDPGNVVVLDPETVKQACAMYDEWRGGTHYGASSRARGARPR